MESYPSAGLPDHLRGELWRRAVCEPCIPCRPVAPGQACFWQRGNLTTPLINAGMQETAHPDDSGTLTAALTAVRLFAVCETSLGSGQFLWSVLPAGWIASCREILAANALDVFAVSVMVDTGVFAPCVGRSAGRRGRRRHYVCRRATGDWICRQSLGAG